MSGKNKSNEISIIRIFNAEIATVWQAWVDDKLSDQWWGPRGFSTTTTRKEVQLDGVWLFKMHGPDQVVYPNCVRYLEVDPYKKLVYGQGMNEDEPSMFKVNVEFSELNHQTKMEMIMTFPSPEAAEEARKIVKLAGGESTWDRLAEFLEKQKSGKDIFVINRCFDADIKTIYDLWTNPDHVMKWTAPTGFSGKYLHADIRPGGESFYEMTGFGMSMYGKAKYLELTPLASLVYTQIFTDQNGNSSRHPMAPTWPETMKTTVYFSEEQPRKTRVTVVWEVFGDASAEEHLTFKNAKEGMAKGWTGSFDKLDEYFKKIVF